MFCETSPLFLRQLCLRRPHSFSNLGDRSIHPVTNAVVER